MKLSSISTILTLTASAVGRTPSLEKSSSIAHSRDVSALGCVDSTGNDQHIEFFSSREIFGMRVPMDDNSYDVGKPAAQLKCIDETSASSTCSPCWDKMDHIVLTHPGSCSFALTGDDGKLFSIQTDNTKGKIALPKAGYLALVTCHKPHKQVLRGTEGTELACGRPHNSTIKLFTGSENYTLNVTPNQTVFDLIGPDSRLGCVGPGGRIGAMCQACDFPVQSLELSTEVGLCAFNFSGYANLIYHDHRVGILSLPNPTQIWSVICGVDDVALRRRDALSKGTTWNLEQRSSKCFCMGTSGGVAFNTSAGNETFLPVPADMQYYGVAGQNPEIECYFYWEMNPMPCHSCYSYEMISMLSSLDLSECRFKIEGWSELLIWPANHHTVRYFDPPIKLIGVQCGFGSPQSNIAPASSISDQGSIDSGPESAGTLTRDTGSDPADSLCQKSGYPVSIFTADGNVYCPPVPLDYEFHPMVDMQCTRPTDGAIVPCCEIGAAISVNSITQWGPCVFFTEDHRSFYISYEEPLQGEPPVTARTPIAPGNAISGIECGTG